MTTEKTDTKKDIRVGVIGMGRIGLVHLEAITKAPGVIPVIVSNPTVSKAEKGKLNRPIDRGAFAALSRMFCSL
jgi:predicted homoserine dehydrogenase-like protein